jgi:hypothetical protein
MTTRPYNVPSAWPFPGQRAAATPAPRKPRGPKLIYTQRPEDCIMTYQQRIAAIVPHVPPAAVEAWMRADHGTLDALSSGQFRLAALTAAQCVIEDPATTDRLRASYGLHAEAPSC